MARIKKILSSAHLLTIILLGLQPTASQAQEVELTWTVNNEPDLVTTRIYRKTHPDSTFIMISSVAYPDSTYMDQNIALNMQYFYAVTAVDSYDSESDFSNIASISTQANPPVAVADQASTQEDLAVDINVLANDSDPEDDPLSVTGVGQPGHGTAVVNANFTVKYTPNPNYNGSDTFSYTAGDGLGGSATAQVTVTINPVNDNPIALADQDTTNENMAVDIAVLANDSDVDGTAPTLSTITQPNNGLTTINGNGTVKYTPDSGFSGTDTFSYTAIDGSGGSATAQVTVVVRDVIPPRPSPPRSLQAAFRMNQPQP